MDHSNTKGAFLIGCAFLIIFFTQKTSFFALSLFYTITLEFSSDMVIFHIIHKKKMILT